MLKVNKVSGSGFRLGLSVAVVALSAGMAWAEDDVIVTDEDGEIMIGEEGTFETPDVFIGDGSDEDMIAWSGEVIDDVVTEDPEYLEDIPGDTGEDDPVYAEGEEGEPVPMESECGGCEYTTTDLDGRPVMINARGGTGAVAKVDGWDNGGGVDPFARGNICFDEATYVGLLCDWQRPFLGDSMPAE